MDADMDAGSNEVGGSDEGAREERLGAGDPLQAGDPVREGDALQGSAPVREEDLLQEDERMQGADRSREDEQPVVAEIVAAYLADLSREAERLDDSGRHELLDDVRSHIEVALAEAENPDRAEVTRILTALGEPREIVDAAAPEPPATSAIPAMSTAFAPAPEPWDPGPPYPLGGREIVAIAMLLIGFVLAGVGWLAGVWLLWSSPRWTRRDKLLGTFVVPGGLAPLLLVMGMSSSGQSCTGYGDAPPVCTQEGHGLSSWGAAIAVTLLVVLPLLTTFLLWHRARAVRPLVPGGGAATAGVLVGVVAALGIMVAGCGAFLVASSGSGKQPASPAPAVSQEAPVPVSAS